MAAEDYRGFMEGYDYSQHVEKVKGFLLMDSCGNYVVIPTRGEEMQTIIDLYPRGQLAKYARTATSKKRRSEIVEEYIRNGGLDYVIEEG